MVTIAAIGQQQHEPSMRSPSGAENRPIRRDEVVRTNEEGAVDRDEDRPSTQGGRVRPLETEVLQNAPGDHDVQESDDGHRNPGDDETAAALPEVGRLEYLQGDGERRGSEGDHRRDEAESLEDEREASRDDRSGRWSRLPGHDRRIVQASPSPGKPPPLSS